CEEGECTQQHCDIGEERGEAIGRASALHVTWGKGVPQQHDDLRMRESEAHRLDFSLPCRETLRLQRDPSLLGIPSARCHNPLSDVLSPCQDVTSKMA